MMQPFLRWAGSKRQSVYALKQYWPGGFTRYIEPFAGSACLYFNLSPYRAILSDINLDLINTYKEIKSNVAMVLENLSLYEGSRDEYFSIRELDSSKLTASENAARFIYLNRYCFNGLYRTNRSGKFNVPYGGGRSGRLPDEIMLRACSNQLVNTDLLSNDFEDTLSLAVPGDFVYLDPPYSVKARRVFNEYDRSVFSPKDLQRLRIWLEYFRESDIDFLVSYAECDEAENLAKGFNSRVISIKRNIAGFTGSRGEAREILISNSRLSIKG